MAKTMKKAVKAGKQFASAAKARVQKEVKALIAAGIIDKKEAKKLLNALTSELKAEGQRIAKFARQEVTRGMKKARKKAKPVIRGAIRGAVKRWKKARQRKTQ
jgi:polyhydroxyalkanoate synthesis regulator phasin